MRGYIEALQRARLSEKEVAAELEHVERLKKIITYSQNSTQKHALSNIKKLELFERQLNVSIDIAVDRKRVALMFLSELEGSERIVLYRYYILAEEWETIAEKMYMSTRQVYNIRKKALARLEEISEELQETWTKEAI